MKSLGSLQEEKQEVYKLTMSCCCTARSEAETMMKKGIRKCRYKDTMKSSL